MDIQKAVNSVSNREELSDFVEELRLSLKKDKSSWENKDLSSFLEAMAAWISDMDGYFESIGEESPTQPEWKTFAQILAAAKVYE